MRFCTSSFSKNKILCKNNFVFMFIAQKHKVPRSHDQYDQPEHTTPSSRHHHPLYRTKWYYGLDPSPQKSARKDIPTTHCFREQKWSTTQKNLAKQTKYCSREQKWSATHTNLAKQTNFCSREQKWSTTHKFQLSNCKIINEHMNQQTEFIHCRFHHEWTRSQSEPATPPAYHQLDAHYDSVVDEPHPS